MRDNGVELRAIIEASGFTQAAALATVNGAQAFPIPLNTWKSYLAAPSSKRRRSCPDNVLQRARNVLPVAHKSAN